MKRTARDNRDRYRPRPVEKVELNQEHAGRRLLTAGVLLIFGVGLLVYAFMGLLAPETGWKPVQANSGAGVTCAGDFTFLYQSGSTAEVKGVTALYTEASRKAFQMFHSGEEFEGVANVCTINRHPNEVLEVDGTLYRALSAIVESGRRELYLGPVYDRYDDLFFCGDDAQLMDFDPQLSEEVRREYGEILAFANDPQAIGLELLGEDRVRLNVSEAYLNWAEAAEDVKWIDFAWMKNAFIADYLAEELTAGGYTNGTLSSYDGFTRNLDGREVDYAYLLHHRQGDTIYPAADLHYTGRLSLARLRNYPIGEADFLHYYELRTGEIRTCYLDPADALCKSAVDTLVCYSREKSCAQLLLEMIPVYITDSFQQEAIAALAGKGTQSVYCQDSTVLYTDPDAVLDNFFDEDGVRYTARQIEQSK